MGVVRTFRVGRVLRLLRGAPTLRLLFNTFVVSLPSLVNVGALFVLVLFIYAVMGLQLFAKVRHNGSLDEDANFMTFGHSILTLMRFATGEGWNDIMHAIIDAQD